MKDNDGYKNLIIGSGKVLRRVCEHPYINRTPVELATDNSGILEDLNMSRDNSRGENTEVDYYFEVENDGKPMEGLRKAARMVLEHGTLKPWHNEGDANTSKPAGYDDYMSWATNIRLLGFNGKECIECGIVTIAYPSVFFDKTDSRTFPMAQLMMAIASEPFSAFSFYKAARIIDIRIPEGLVKRFPGIKWPHSRIRNYLRIDPSDPIIGTIVKPKTGLNPELFSRAVVEAAKAGASFTKADENMHMTLKDVSRFVGRTVNDLLKEGFDLGNEKNVPKGRRLIFAPHITAEPGDMMDYASAAIESGANALMLSPYYGGGFQKLAEIAARFDVPIYAHTAGMNVYTGSHTWGIDPSIFYKFAAYFGAAFMQITAVKGYLKPDDIEKTNILEKLRREKLEGKDGMTLVIAGGLGPHNIGINIRELGIDGRMLLAGTYVYSHPDGPHAGVRAMVLAYEAYSKYGITGKVELIEYGLSLGYQGQPLVRAISGNNYS